MDRSILVPLDGSAAAEAALPLAVSLLSAGDHLLLLRVISPPEADLAAGLPGAQGFAESCRAALAALAERIAHPAEQTAVEVVVGDPATEIVRVAEDRRVGLVAMATHGRGAVGRTVFGSVADRVARVSPVPVLLVRPEAAKGADGRGIRRLVVPLDGSALAEAALPIAADIARRLAVPVRLVEAIDPAVLVAPARAPGLPRFSLAPAAYAAAFDEIRAVARRSLEAAAARLTAAGVDATWEILDGPAFDAVAGAVTEGDLVVLASHGRGGALRWLLGSVAENLVREAPAPVVLVPAPGRGAAQAEPSGAGRREAPAKPAGDGGAESDHGRTGASRTARATPASAAATHDSRSGPPTR